MEIGNSLQTIHLYLLDSTIIICKENDLEQPVYIICLDGLEVKRTFDKGRGFAIEITHRDGLYPTKTIFLKNE